MAAAATAYRRGSNSSQMSRSSSQFGDHFVRSRAWSEDITKTWNAPVGAAESFTERAERYSTYFTLSKLQLERVFDEFVKELELGLNIHAENPLVPINPARCSLKMLDTCIDKVPNGTERGVAFALDFGGTNIRAVRVRLEGANRLATSEVKMNLRDEQSAFPNGLLDKKCGAIYLFDKLAHCVRDLMKKSGDLGKELDCPVGFTFCFPAELRGVKSAFLIRWTKGFETGRQTRDPVEGMDVAALLDVAFWRNEVNARTVAVVNDTVGTLLACAYEKPAKLPPCTVGFILGTGVNGAYVESRAKRFGFAGLIVNTELGGFDKGLPVTDVDLEVDFADEGGRGTQMYEKMVSGGYLGEVCRRLVVKVWQSQAPALAWARQSLPAAAASLCVSDASPRLEMVLRIMKSLWDWEPSYEDRAILQRLFSLVFFRSAGLAACGIAALAQQSGRLQPAMGGVTVAVDGSLYTQNSWYGERIKMFLIQLLGEEVAKHIHLVISDDGSGKGAAVLAGVMGC